jgi:hypothetical protein
MSPISLRVLVIFKFLQTTADLLLLYVFPIGDGQLIQVTYSIIKPLEYGVYAYLFNDRIRSVFSYRYAWLSSIGVGLISAIQLLFAADSRTVATNIIILQGLLTLILVLLYFRSILFTKNIVLLWNEPLFWIATGLLFFYAGNIVATGFYHQLRQYSIPLAKNLYLLNYTLNMLNFLLTSIAFVIATKTTRSYAR